MDDDEDESQRPRGPKRKGLDYFGLFLLVSSLIILFNPDYIIILVSNEWQFWGLLLSALAILAFSIILLIVNTVFQLFEKRRADRSQSQPTPNWLINLKVLAISLVILFVPIIFTLLLV